MQANIPTTVLAALAAAAVAHADPLLDLDVVEGGDYFIVDSGMTENAPAFDSEDGRYENVPEFLIGGDYVRTDADDKDDDDTEFVVTVQQPATIYILHADAAGLPGWISADYTDTGEDLILDTDDDLWTYSIYSQELTGSGEVDLTFLQNCNFDLDDDIMYGVVGVASDNGEQDCPKDLDSSGTIDLTDLNLVLANFGATTPDGDTNNDGVVDLADINAVLAAFGTDCP